MPSPQTLYQLIQKYQAGTASAEEIAQLNDWYHSFDDTQAEVYLEASMTETELADKIRLRLAQSLAQEPAKSRKKRYFLPVAASFLLLVVSGSIYFLLNKNKEPRQLAQRQTQALAPANADITPGGNKALLTLADGSVIELDSAANGLLGTQGLSEIVKLENGQLAYRVNGRLLTENDEAFYNTITTPRGGQYQVTLSDGTKVWLNAASSIRFPVVFTGKERRVEVTGETYFEVASDVTKPFQVKAEQSEVEVLGTHFNINAYKDEENLKVTLLEGKVRVSSSITLLPGQQAQLSANNQITTSNNVDLEEVMAWKNGRFQFKSADLRSILRQISRWYDVDVEYRGNVNLHFTGQLTRNQNVSKVFEHLELTGEVHFRTEGRKIIVTR